MNIKKGNQKKLQILSLMFLFLFIVKTSAFSELKYEMMWNLKGNIGFSGPNEIRDPETGKTLGIVVCEVGNGIICLTPQGTRMWEYAMVPPVTAYPAVADVDGDGVEDIVTADAAGNVVLLSHTGKLKWQAHTPGGIRAKSCATIVDLDGNNQPEILVGDIAGFISCFDSQGKLCWRFQGQGTQMGPPLVADIYNTKGKEIIVTSHDGHIYALTARGGWLWDIYRENDLFPNSTPMLADVDSNNIPELYIGGGLHHFYKINLNTGKIELEENVYLHVNDAICATDFDGDGKDEIIFGNKGGSARCFADKGFVWKRDLHNCTMSYAPLVINFDDDSDLEIMFACRGIQILNQDGSLLYDGKIPSQVNSNQLAGDFDGDGYLETIIAGHGMFGSNIVACLKWNVPYQENPRAWTTFAGNRAHTGRLPAAREYPQIPFPARKKMSAKATFNPVGDFNLLSGENTWRFDVSNPQKEKLVLLTEILYPDASTIHFARHVYPETQRIAVSFDVKDAGTYRIKQELVDIAQRAIVSAKEMELSFKGLTSDKQYLNDVLFKQTESILKSWRQNNPAAVADFEERLNALKGQLVFIEAAGKEESTGNLSSIISSARRLRSLAVAGQALAPKSSFFAWEFSPWAWFDPVETLPLPENQTERLETELCSGEYESLALNLTNVTARTFDVRVMAGVLIGEQNFSVKDHIEFRQAVSLYSIQREQIADALPLLNQARLITIPPMETKQLWITINAKNLTPGDYIVNLHFKSIEPNPSEVKLPLNIKVHDLALPRPRPLKFCVWSRAGKAPEYELQDQVEHGVNVHFGALPQAKCNADGEIVGEIDFTEHDAVMTRLSPYGIIMLVSPQASLKGQTFLSAPWRRAFVKYVRTWIAHIKELGVDYKNWAFYPYDEPSTPYAKTTLNLVEVAKLIREADPDALIYADPTSGTTMESIKMLSGLLDIWCPSAELLERFGDNLIPTIRPMAKEAWFYDAAGRSRTLSCLGIYRWRFWYAWNLGLTGVGWWTYYYGDHLWDGPNPSGDYFSSVYTAPGTIVTSKRWEVAREGIEDYEMLFLLKQLINRAKKQGIKNAVLSDAEKLLVTLPKTVEAALHETGRRTPITPDGVPVYNRATEVVQDARKQIIEVCLRIKETMD